MGWPNAAAIAATLWRKLRVLSVFYFYPLSKLPVAEDYVLKAEPSIATLHSILNIRYLFAEVIYRK